QRLPTQTPVSRFPPYRPQGKRKREIHPLLQRRIGQRRDATRAPIWSLANSKRAGRQRPAQLPPPLAGASGKAINPRGSGGQVPQRQPPQPCSRKHSHPSPSFSRQGPQSNIVRTLNTARSFIPSGELIMPPQQNLWVRMA